MKTIDREKKFLISGFSVLAILLIASSIYSHVRMNSLSERISSLYQTADSLTINLASTTKELQANISKTNTSLSTALSDQQKNVGAIKKQLGGFQDQVGDLSGSLNTLQKLAQTDHELLKKYSKAYFLNENYVPARLTEIPKDYQYSDTKQLLIHTDVLPHLTSMIDAAGGVGLKLYTHSAYRSFAEQRALKGDYTVIYGAGTANSFSADQGYSEHQLGTAVDMITSGIGGVLDNFDGTAADKWMIANAYKYGFVISYPKDNTYYISEPWHWRFVGVKLATYLHDQKKSLYDLDQKTIDTYLVSIFD